ncbi:MAG TPA: hypothetical protein VNQ80_04265 [Parapedobacter sp.]|uniref:hypothetical protein n=1 Tax=Parapedobacter sp. TaxID=1958893 RepID=UPI002D15E0FE|nr:hypothetical protein [Parapedobacter sp.]HWK56525.1 hypothetical protein [Parapedobacter sp.]
MITLQTITGLLIAAVLNVLGTGQHEVAQVENEPVVKEVTEKQNNDRWFLIEPKSPFGNQDDQDNQEITAMLDEDADPGCNEEDIICAVKLDVTGVSSPSSLVGSTVSEALDDGATEPSTGYDYRYHD